VVPQRQAVLLACDVPRRKPLWTGPGVGRQSARPRAPGTPARDEQAILGDKQICLMREPWKRGPMRAAGRFSLENGSADLALTLRRGAAAFGGS